jgi:hypothetical protein
MSRGLDKLKKIVGKSVAELIAAHQFSTWLKEAKAVDRDVVVINNSFVYRSKPLIKTSKNDQYLCLKVKGTQADPRAVFVGRPGDLNSDFKLFSAKSANLPPLEILDRALQTEMERLGRLVFVLIGELQDVPAVVPVTHSLVKKLRFDPSAARRAVLEDGGHANKTIVVNQLTDPESAWNDIRPKLEQEVGDDLSSVETAFGGAFEKLQDEARLKLVLPSPTISKTATSFIARLRESVSQQRRLYETALQQCTSGGAAADGHLREAMRIAYNFADDAIKVLQLLVSVADLKGVLLWCTIKEHFDVAEAFRSLPWTKSHKKPSLERYREIIGGARNRAFHNLLAFDRTIEADLEGLDVKARRLTLLPAYERRKTTVPFDYEDREIVEILTELTRAPEVAVPFNFWKKNADVMKAFEMLLARTEDALWALRRAQG